MMKREYETPAIAVITIDSHCIMAASLTGGDPETNGIAIFADEADAVAPEQSLGKGHQWSDDEW